MAARLPRRSGSTSTKLVTLADGSELAYDGLVIATGRRAREWPAARQTVSTRCARSKTRMALARGGRDGPTVVIVGAGFIGCEVAATLRTAGVERRHPRRRRRSADAGDRRACGPRARASCTRSTASASRSVPASRASRRDAVEASPTGARLAADLVLVAVGVAPNTEWLVGSGLELRPRLRLAATMHCFAAEDVVAVGDCAAWPHPRARRGRRHRALDERPRHGPRRRRQPARATSARHSCPSPASGRTSTTSRSNRSASSRPPTTFEVVEDDPAAHRLVVEAHDDGGLVGVVLFNRARLQADYQRRLVSGYRERDWQPNASRAR